MLKANPVNGTMAAELATMKHWVLKGQIGTMEAWQSGILTTMAAGTILLAKSQIQLMGQWQKNS